MTDHEQIAALKARITELEAEVERLFRVAGMGGHAGDAPEEMLLCGLADHGCDAWQHVVRVCIGSEDAIQRAIKDGRLTEPVRYVRASCAPPLPEL
jgi:hypothetical protein